jgi:tRNA pseudouridine65 synthase
MSSSSGSSDDGDDNNLYKTATMARIAAALVLIACLSRSHFVSTLSFPKKARPRIPVLQYHDDWVCVNKPAGMSMNRSKNSKRSEFVLTTLVKRQLARKIFPVHPLDHRTSGAILFAFDSETCGRLHQALSKGTKQYIALLRGPWQHANDSVSINRPLKDANTNITKTAITHFTLLATRENATLVKCEIETGRFHQIRRHAAKDLGQPVRGDTQHGNSQHNRWWRTRRKLNRLALHSLSITLGEKVIVAPLPPDFRSVLEKEPLWQIAINKEPRLLLEPIDEQGGTFGRHYRQRQKHDAKPNKSTSSESSKRVV